MIKDLIAKVSSMNTSQKTAPSKVEGGENQEAEKGLFGLMLQSVQSEEEGQKTELIEGEITEGLSTAEEQAETTEQEAAQPENAQGMTETEVPVIPVRFAKELQADNESTDGAETAKLITTEGSSEELSEKGQVIAGQEIKVARQAADFSKSEEGESKVSDIKNSLTGKTQDLSGDSIQSTEGQKVNISESETGGISPLKTDVKSETSDTAKEMITGTTSTESGEELVQPTGSIATSAKQTEAKTSTQPTTNVPTDKVQEKVEANDKAAASRTPDTAEKVVDVRAKTGVPSTEKEIQLQQVKAGEESKKERSERAPLTGRESAEGERLDPVSRESNLRILQGMGNRFGFMNEQGFGEQDASAFTEDQEALLKELKTGTSDKVEFKEAERQVMNSMRLGEFTVQNATVRRTVIPGITQTFSKATSEGKAVPENWQKHHFEFGDGNKIELSTRQVDGVIQLKLASSSPELNRMLQEYSNEIKEHLEKELNINIDLQFDNHQGQEQSAGFGESSSQGGGQQQRSFLNQREAAQPAKVQAQNLQQTVRRFGYNQMEWTA